MRTAGVKEEIRWREIKKESRKSWNMERKGLTESDSSVMISDMKTSQIARKVEQLKRQLVQLGPMHPGSLSEQYNVCGKAGCRCKDPKDPQKHGPYYQLSFTWRGKSRTRFVRAERLADVRQKVTNYKRFRKLTDEWVDLVVELEQLEREQVQ
jgi:RNA polymerase subunit RPABC4/transcription elongation factor Spt4